MYNLGCMLAINRDSSWYSTDYRVYMGSSIIVRLLHRLPLYLCSYKLNGFVTLLLYPGVLANVSKVPMGTSSRNVDDAEVDVRMDELLGFRKC